MLTEFSLQFHCMGRGGLSKKKIVKKIMEMGNSGDCQREGMGEGGGGGYRGIK